MRKSDIDNIFKTLTETIETPKSELDYGNNFQLLVAVILSAQSTDKGVNKATKKLFNLYKTPKDFINLGEEGLKDYIKTVGLFNNKAKSIIKTSEILFNEFNSTVPDSFDNLIKLPGVGRKTANVILNIVYKQPTIAVDTHVFRVSNRVGLVSEDNVKDTEISLLKIVPKDYLLNAHHLLILHGRYVCKAKKPKCNQCSIKKWCLYDKKEG